MTILQVNKLYYPWIGGVEKIVQQISEGLNKKDGLEIEVLCCQPKGKKEEKIINGVKVNFASSFGIFWGMPISFNFFKLFKNLIKNCDLINFHHPFPLGDLAIFLFKPKVKLVVHYHSDIVRQKILSFFFKPFILNTLKKAQKIIVSNPNLVKNSPYLRKFQEKCEIVHFGVDFKKFEKEIKEKEIKAINKKYRKFVLFVGRLNYYKGLDYLIKAMKDVETSLVIIGEGPQKKNLELIIESLNLENKIYFLSFKEEKELINYYKSCSVFVLPSIFKSEAFGIALIEAMACQKPVISTELGTGTSFVNQDGITGFVVPPKDSKSLTEAIKKIISDEKLAKKLGQNAFERVKKEFSLDQMLKETYMIYNDLFKKS